MLITPISNNSTSHIKYPQTSFLGAKTTVLKKAQLATDTFVKTKEPSLKSLSDEFFSLYKKTRFAPEDGGWEEDFIFEGTQKELKEAFVAKNKFLKEVIKNDYLFNNESLKNNNYILLTDTLSNEEEADNRLDLLNKISSTKELRENEEIAKNLANIFCLAYDKTSTENQLKFLDSFIKHKLYESEEFSESVAELMNGLHSQNTKPILEFIEAFMSNDELKNYKDSLFSPLMTIQDKKNAEIKLEILNTILKDKNNFDLEDAIIFLGLINKKEDANIFLNNKKILDSHINEYSEDYKHSISTVLNSLGLNNIDEKRLNDLEDEGTLKTVEAIKKNLIKKPDLFLEGFFEDEESKRDYVEKYAQLVHIHLCMLSKVFDKKTIDYILRQRESSFSHFVSKFLRLSNNDVENFKKVLDKKHSEDPKKNIKEFNLFSFSKNLNVDYSNTSKNKDLVTKTLKEINISKTTKTPIKDFTASAEKYIEYFPDLVEGYSTLDIELQECISDMFLLDKNSLLDLIHEKSQDKFQATAGMCETAKIDINKWWKLDIPSRKVKLINDNNNKLDIISQKIEEDINQLRKGPAGKFVDNVFSEHISDSKFLLPDKIKNNKNELIKFTHSVLSSMNKVWSRAMENSKSENHEISRRAQQTLTIYDHLNQRLDNLNNFDTSSVTKDIEVEIKAWDRVPHKDLFQGNFSTCCIGMNNANQAAIVDYLMSPSYNMIELVDTSNGKTIGNALIYFVADDKLKTHLVIDNIEINDSYIFSDEQSLKLRDSIKDFANDIKKHCLKNKNAKTFLGSSYNDVYTDDLVSKEELMIPLVYSYSHITYLDAFDGWTQTNDGTSGFLNEMFMTAYELK